MIRFLPRSCQLGLTAFTALLIAVSPGLADMEKPRSLISLTGVGKTSASPDIARITSGVVIQAKTAAQALQTNSAAMAKIIAGLKAAGISARDIQTSGFSVNPSYIYDQKNRRNPPRIIGYQVRNQVNITVRQREKLGQILDKMITLGANQINGISFAIDKPREMQDEARKRAVEDAVRKANIYAAATQRKLGKIVSISEGQSRPPSPQYDRRAAALSLRENVPIEAGEQTLSVRVNITWELE